MPIKNKLIENLKFTSGCDGRKTTPGCEFVFSKSGGFFLLGVLLLVLIVFKKIVSALWILWIHHRNQFLIDTFSFSRNRNGVSQTIHPEIKWKKDILEIRNFNPKFSEQDLKQFINPIQERLHKNFATVEIRKGVARFYPAITENILLKNLIQHPKVPFQASICVSMKREQINFDFAQANNLLIVGQPGSGKSEASKSAAFILLEKNPFAKVLIISTKLDLDFRSLKSSFPGRVLGLNPNENLNEVLIALQKLDDDNRRLYAKMSAAGVSHIQQLQDFGTSPETSLKILICDELASYTKKERAEAEEKEVVGQITNIINVLLREGRAYGCINLLMIQNSTADESNLKLSYAQRILAGTVRTAQSSRELFGSDEAFDSTLNQGFMLLKQNGTIQKVKTALTE